MKQNKLREILATLCKGQYGYGVDEDLLNSKIDKIKQWAKGKVAEKRDENRYSAFYLIYGDKMYNNSIKQTLKNIDEGE